jgi:uncharacterized protein DUF4953
VEDSGLEAIVHEGMARGLRFLTNPDEGDDNSYPEGTTWINGRDAVEELGRVQAVRDTLVARFDERAIRPGEPMALLSRRFATVYLQHRYTLGAATKAVGGMEYRYGVRGDSLPVTRIIPAARQRRALELLLDAIQPTEPRRRRHRAIPGAAGWSHDAAGVSSSSAPGADRKTLGWWRTVKGRRLHQCTSAANRLRAAMLVESLARASR